MCEISKKDKTKKDDQGNNQQSNPVKASFQKSSDTFPDRSDTISVYKVFAPCHTQLLIGGLNSL